MPLNTPERPNEAGSAGVNMKMVELLHAALAKHQAGDIRSAGAMYREVLDHHPDNPDALHLLGAVHKQEGDLDSARRLMERAVEINPNNPHIQGNYAVVLMASGRLEDAVDHLRRAIALNPMDANSFGNLGNALMDLDRAEEAIPAFESALRFDPTPRAIHRNFANLLIDAGRLDEAEDLLTQYLGAFAADPEGNNNLGYILEQRGEDEAAETYFRRAHEGAPDSAEIASNLANVLNRLGRADEAAIYYEKAMELKPNDPGLLTNRIAACMGAKRHGEAMPLLQQLIAAAPNTPTAHNDLGLCFAAGGDLVKASECFANAANLDGSRADYFFNLGTVMMGRNLYPESIAAFRQALKAEPRAVKPHANLCQALKLNRQYDEANLYAHATMLLEGYEAKIFPALLPAFRATCDLDGIAALGDTMAICENLNAETLLGAFLDQLPGADDEESCRRFADLHFRWGDAAAAIAAEAPLPKATGGGAGPGKLRIGILSADLRSHAVTKFVKPWFWNFDRERFEIYCYSPVTSLSDPQQAAIRAQVSAFRFVENMSDRQVAETVLNDGVDILFELNGATHNGRLGALAYKPAPVQVSWLGYPFTSGLQTMDYVLQDRFVRPTVDGLWREDILEMPNGGSWIAFTDFPDEPIAAAPPMVANGFVTFGTMNAVYKFTPEIFALWARVLKAVPDSKFLLARPELTSSLTNANIVKGFAAHGIGAERLLVIANETGQFGHFQHYNEIDITLDTYPVVGGTTTCDALWMGVPVIGRYGINMHQRINHAILNHCGLGDYSVASDDDYVAKAVELAGDPARIAEMRAGLRGVIAASPLCDSQGFARNIEQLLGDIAAKHGLG